MGPIRIDPQKALDEALKLQQKLSAGAQTLRALDPVSFGVTPKEELLKLLG